MIGIVFRGNLWLDGIVTCRIEPSRHDYVPELARAIVRSRQYSQIHAVILSREDLVPGVRIDISDLARRINAPVISIIGKTVHPRTPSHQEWRTSHKSKADRFEIEIGGRFVPVRAAGISSEGAREIFAVGCVDGNPIPEALRVAELVAKHVPRRNLFLGNKDSVQLSSDSSRVREVKNAFSTEKYDYREH